MRALLLALALLLSALAADAGTLTRDELLRRFPSPYIVGEKDAELPVWPIFRKNMTSTELAAYVFESIDFAPIPGFSGVPINLLIALDTSGAFLDVAVLSHHEPVFLDGLGEAPMFRFVSQYRALSLKQNIRISMKGMSGAQQEGANVYLDGVAKATASVRIINQSALSAALKVARRKLGFAEGRDPDLVARVRSDVFEPMTLAQLRRAGLVTDLRVRNRDIEQTFAGSNGAGLDPQVLRRPDDIFVALEASQVSVPTVGRNLLGQEGWDRLQGRLEPGDHAVMIISSGTYGVVGDDFTRASVPDRLALRQGSLPIEIRDLDLDLRLPGRPDLPPDAVKIFRIISQAGLDPAQPLEFALHVTRKKGIVYPEKISRDLQFSLRLPAAYYIAAEADNKSWQGIWRQRGIELAVLGCGLLCLGWALVRQQRLSANARQFAWFRFGFLLFTTVFIGWYAQGQLSIVNLTSIVQALLAGRSLEFVLFDPMSLSLWVFVLVSLVVWGRGTFCGWLCPFGALQEFTGKLARLLRVPQLRLRATTDARLKRLKYGLLAAIIASTVLSPALTDQLVELEPFKTAITLNFMRSWPYVAYAGGMLLASMVVYKFFCRYLCPLGAGLALFGRFRLLDWIPRRSECGTPCQTCRHRCDYQAIRPSGAIDYEECFQCMDCVVIHASDELCAPLILEKKRARVVPIQPDARSRTA